MRDLVYLRRLTKALFQQLQPTGRAWQYPDDSDSAREQSVKSEMSADFLYEVETFVSKILPDNDLFDEQAAIDWERRLGLDYDPSTLTLEERRAEITRKLSYPGGFKYTLTLEFIEYQLRASLFDVHVYRNPNQSQPAGTELIANSVDKEDGFAISNFYHTFIIAGADINTQAIIKSERRQEFIRKVLKYKPMNMVCFLNSTISKQDGVFKLKYNTYTCERIEETPPYATNVNITGLPEVGQTLTGAYTYNNDQGDAEIGTILQWYRADDAIGTNKVAISGSNSISYLLEAADANKFITFGVKPANIKSFGDEVLSDYTTAVDPAIVPVITQFEGDDVNTLTWNMSDGTESTGTWQVEYSLDGGSWIINISGGSPRENVLPIGLYNQNVDFRVKRISAPATEYSNVLTVAVGEIYFYQQYYTEVVNVVGYENSDPTGICTTGNAFTDSIYMKNNDQPSVLGPVLYYKANDDIIRQATWQNIQAYPPKSGGLSNITQGGIRWIRFISWNNEVWDVQGLTAQPIAKSTQYSCS